MERDEQIAQLEGKVRRLQSSGHDLCRQKYAALQQEVVRLRAQLETEQSAPNSNVHQIRRTFPHETSSPLQRSFKKLSTSSVRSTTPSPSTPAKSIPAPEEPQTTAETPEDKVSDNPYDDQEDYVRSPPSLRTQGGAPKPMCRPVEEDDSDKLFKSSVSVYLRRKKAESVGFITKNRGDKAAGEVPGANVRNGVKNAVQAVVPTYQHEGQAGISEDIGRDNLANSTGERSGLGESRLTRETNEGKRGTGDVVQEHASKDEDNPNSQTSTPIDGSCVQETGQSSLHVGASCANGIQLTEQKISDGTPKRQSQKRRKLLLEVEDALFVDTV